MRLRILADKISLLKARNLKTYTICARLTFQDLVICVVFYRCKVTSKDVPNNVAKYGKSSKVRKNLAKESFKCMDCLSCNWEKCNFCFDKLLREYHQLDVESKTNLDKVAGYHQPGLTVLSIFQPVEVDQTDKIEALRSCQLRLDTSALQNTQVKFLQSAENWGGLEVSKNDRTYGQITVPHNTDQEVPASTLRNDILRERNAAACAMLSAAMDLLAPLEVSNVELLTSETLLRRAKEGDREEVRTRDQLLELADLEQQVVRLKATCHELEMENLALRQEVMEARSLPSNTDDGWK